MNTQKIYNHYMVPNNLQEHMLRVAALASIILDRWRGNVVDKEAIIQACLFHDIAKPMTFNPKIQEKFGMSQGDIARLISLQQKLKNDYGEEEHQATVKIAERIGLKPLALKLLENLEWKYIPQLVQRGDTASLLPIYCDMRIGPKGILLLTERLQELKDRTGEVDYEKNLTNGKVVEALIQSHTGVLLNKISDEQINAYFETLLNWEV